MKCDCGYKTDNKRAFLNHTRNGCTSKGVFKGTVVCPCGKIVIVPPSRVGRKKFCSKKCRDDNYVRPLGIIPNFINGNKGWFKEGEQSDSNHPNWVGDKVCYTALHSWVHRKLGKACKCDECGITKSPDGMTRFFHWANISGKYKRDLTDWKQLCAVCHRKFDEITKLSKQDAIDIRTRYENGETQKSLAEEHKVSDTLIYKIVHKQTKYYAS